MNLQLLITKLLIHRIRGHMELWFPSPRNSPFNEWYKKQGLIDYNLSSPLGNKDTQFYAYPCRGSNRGPAQAIYKAGDNIELKFRTGLSNHAGGHCQIGISYNNGKDIAIISTILTTCFKTTNSIQIQLPYDLPASKSALLSWSWVNSIGIREYYQNCVDVEIVNPDSECKSFTALENLIVNLPGYEVIPEFYLDKRIELFNKRKNVTIYNYVGSSDVVAL